MGLPFTPVEVTGYEAVLQAVKDRQADAGVVSNGYGSANAGRYRPGGNPPDLQADPAGGGLSQREAPRTLRHHRRLPEKDGKTSRTPFIWPPTGAGWERPGAEKACRLTPERAGLAGGPPHLPVAFDGYFPPYSYLTDDGRVEGLAVDILTLWPTGSGSASTSIRSSSGRTSSTRPSVARSTWWPPWSTGPSGSSGFLHPALHLQVPGGHDPCRRRDHPEREDIAGKRVALVRGYQYVPRSSRISPPSNPITSTPCSTASTPSPPATPMRPSPFSAPAVTFRRIWDRQSEVCGRL